MMDASIYDMSEIDVAWCPGCGNFPILKSLKNALVELEIRPSDLVMVSGIGQAAKLPHYLKANVFNGLHGRSIPVATAVKAANPHLTVIAESGDGCMYGEGGNHFIHGIRRNPDLTHIVHNNMVYGLTKGQASPTSQPGFVTPIQVKGAFPDSFNPLAVAIALGASFVARAFSGDGEHTTKVIKQAIQHRGYALVDILQPCVSFNKVNTFAWFKEHSYKIENTYDPTDQTGAFATVTQKDRFAIGVLYERPGRPTFEQSLPLYRDDARPLWERDFLWLELAKLLEKKRGV
jgi:2-oxoglutarate ferredoxin oxidoreductase subunit beta